MIDILILIMGVVVLAVACVAAALAWGTRQTLAEVHDLVNSRMDEMVERVDQLTQTLQDSGTAVPPPRPASEKPT